MKSAAHQYEDKLLEFAYGELAQHEADAVDAHVRGCTRCSQALSEIRGVRATMSQLPMAAAPEAGLESLMAYAEQAAKRSASKTAPSLWKRFLMPLASVMALAVVGVVGFRANQEFDTSPGSAVADQKVEEVARAKQQGGENAQAQPPAPVVAAVAPPADVETPRAEADQGLENLKQGAKEKKKLDDLSEAGGKRGAVWTPEPKQSVTRRAGPSKGPSVTNDAQYRDDYSNAAGRGALAKDEPSPPPPPMQDKVSYGLGAPGGAPSNEPPAPSAPKVTKPAPAPPRAIAQKEEDGKAPEEAPVAAAPSTLAAPSPKKSKSSFDLRPLQSSTGSSSADLDDSAAMEKSDSLGVNRDAKYAERQRAEQRTQSLESARVASNRGDRLSEIRLAAQVLESGASGYERVEALKRICDAYESLGEPDRADPFCDLLLREFPNTAAARAVSERRKQVQRAAPSTRKQAAEQESKALDEAKPTEKAPASAY